MTTYVHKHEVEAIQIPFDIIIVKPADKRSNKKEERLPCPAMGYIVRKGDTLITLSKAQFDREYQPKRTPPKSISLAVGEWTPIDDDDDDDSDENSSD